MDFNSNKIMINDANEMMYVLDSFKYEEDYYALTKCISSENPGGELRIYKKRSADDPEILVDDPSLVINMTLEFNKRNPGMLSSSIPWNIENDINTFDTSYIGLVRKTDLESINDARPIIPVVLNMESVKKLDISDDQKQLLTEILVTALFFDDPESLVRGGLRIEKVTELLLHIDNEYGFEKYIKTVILNIAHLERDFPCVFEAVKCKDMAAFAVAGRFITTELQKYQDISPADLITYSNAREVMTIANIAHRIISKENNKTAGNLKVFLEEYPPNKIVEYLDQYIVGQNEAKKAVAMTLYRHIAVQAYSEKALKKDNLLIYGPSGSGKTELFRIITKISPVPVYIRSAAEVTANGYSGADIDEMILGLDPSSDNISNALVVLDEADKLFMPEYDSNGQNVNQAIQGDLLKTVEGTVLTKGMKSVDTDKMTFIFVGAFADLYNKKTSQSQKRSIGFNSACQHDDKGHSDVISITEFIAFGMIPELARRISNFCPVRKLTVYDYRQIFFGISNSIMDEINELLSINDIKLNLVETEALVDELAESAEALDLGASGMRSLFEQAVNAKFFDTFKNNERTINITKGDIIDAAAYFRGKK